MLTHVVLGMPEVQALLPTEGGRKRASNHFSPMDFPRQDGERMHVEQAERRDHFRGLRRLPQLIGEAGGAALSRERPKISSSDCKLLELRRIRRG